MVFQRTIDAESVPLLAFNSVCFWVQLHNVPTTSLKPEMGEAVGNSIGTIVHVAEPEDDGVRGDVLRIRVAMDITKALPRCCKLWAKGEHIEWALLKYDRLPNFCF